MASVTIKINMSTKLRIQSEISPSGFKSKQKFINKLFPIRKLLSPQSQVLVISIKNPNIKMSLNINLNSILKSKRFLISMISKRP